MGPRILSRFLALAFVVVLVSVVIPRAGDALGPARARSGRGRRGHVLVGAGLSLAAGRGVGTGVPLVVRRDWTLVHVGYTVVLVATFPLVALVLALLVLQPF